MIPGDYEVIFTLGGKYGLRQTEPHIYCTYDLAAANEELGEFFEIAKGEQLITCETPERW